MILNNIVYAGIRVDMCISILSVHSANITCSSKYAQRPPQMEVGHGTGVYVCVYARVYVRRRARSNSTLENKIQIERKRERQRERGGH